MASAQNFSPSIIILFFLDSSFNTVVLLAAEKDKKHIEEKLVNSSKSFDDLKCQFIKLSEKLDNAEKIIETGIGDI